MDPFSPRPHAHSVSFTHFPQMRSVVVDHAIATTAPAPCCSRTCSPRRTSRYVACHARRRCDGPCEWGSLSRAHSHVSAWRVMRAGASPQVALPLLSPFEHGTVWHAPGPVETAMHQRTHARIPTAWATCAGTALLHGRYDARPSPQNTWTAPFEERRVARHGLKLRPTPVFLNAILHEITRTTLGPALPLVHHVSV